jgi:hypothetical protein
MPGAFLAQQAVFGAKAAPAIRSRQVARAVVLRDKSNGINLTL